MENIWNAIRTGGEPDIAWRAKEAVSKEVTLDLRDKAFQYPSQITVHFRLTWQLQFTGHLIPN